MRSRLKRVSRESEARLERHLDTVAAGAGFRVLRELGEGGTSRVCLVVPLDADPFSPLDPSLIVLKVARFEGGDAARVREDRILASVRSPHVVALLGTPGRETSALLLEYLPGGTLAELLARRGFIRVGEAVTILVSLVRALVAFHAAGYWHGSLSPSKVMFAADGRPVLVGLSHAVTVSPQAGSERGASSAAPDDDGFREIVTLLAEAVGDEPIVPEAGELMALARSGLPSSMTAAGWQQLEAQVFGVGRPEPVLLVPPSAVPVQTERSAPAVVLDDPGQSRGVVATARRWLDPGRVGALGRLVRAKRKLVLFTAGCLLLAGTVAVTTAASPPSARTAPTTPASGEAAPGPAEKEREGEPVPSGSASGPPASSQAGIGAPTDAVQHDDPVNAAVRLLRARFECFSGTRIDQRCLDPVLQPGAALDDSDRAALRAGASAASAGSFDFRDYEVSLVERMGDAALLALTPSSAPARDDHGTTRTKPASLLIVRGEAGWRLRELFEN